MKKIEAKKVNIEQEQLDCKIIRNKLVNKN